MPPSKTTASAAVEPKLVPKKGLKDPYIPTEKTPFFQDLMGGLPRATITGFLGAPEACKTMLSTQVAVEGALAEGGNVLILDTENKFHQHFHLTPALAERFGNDLNLVRVGYSVETKGSGDNKTETVEWELQSGVDPKATNIFLIHCPDVRPISTMLGRGFEFKNFDSGKYKVMVKPGGIVDPPEETPLGQFLAKYKIAVVVYDSFTNPTDEIPAVGENLPARTDLSQILMLQWHKLAEIFDIPVLMTFHESKNETNPFSKQLKYEGGKSVGYGIPYWVYLLKANEMGLLPKAATKPKTLASDQRAMYVARHADLNRRPWKQVRYFTINSTGLVDGQSSGEDDGED